MNIKLTQLKELTSTIKDNTVFYIVQDGESKKITYKQLKGLLKGLDEAGLWGSINPQTQTENLQNGFYIAETSGTYTNANNIVVTEGYYTILEKNDSGWKVASSVKMPTLSAEGKVEEGNTQAVSGGEVFDSPLNDIYKMADKENIATSNQKFNKNTIVNGYIDYIDGSYITDSNRRRSAKISLKGNVSKTIQISNIHNIHHALGWRINDVNGNMIKRGYANADVTSFSVIFSELNNADTFEFTVNSGKGGESGVVTYDIMVNWGNTILPYEPYVEDTNFYFGDRFESKFAEKVKKKPTENNDIVSLEFFEQELDNYSPDFNPINLKYRDLDKTFLPPDNNYITPNYTGFIRKYSGKLNAIKLYLGKNSYTKNLINVRIGYVPRLVSVRVESGYSNSFVELINFSINKENIPNSLEVYQLDLPNEIEVPEQMYLVILFDTSFTTGYYDLTNQDFNESDYKMLYRFVDPLDDKYSYGYRYSTGIEVLLVNRTAASLYSDIYNTNKLKKLENKKIAVLGDSVTSASDSWANQFFYLAKSDFRNLAVSGARFMDYPDTTIDFSGANNNNNNTIFNQVLRLLRLTTPIGEQIKITHPISSEVFEVSTDLGVGLGSFESPDLITISIGTNDSANSTLNLFENYIDTNWLDLDRKLNLVTGMMWALEALKSAYPKAQIIITTPIQAYKGGNRDFLITRQKRDRIVEVSQYYSTDLIDAFYKLGIQGRFETNGQGVFLHDGLHPNSEGKILMRDFLGNNILNLFNK